MYIYGAKTRAGHSARADAARVDRIRIARVNGRMSGLRLLINPATDSPTMVNGPRITRMTRIRHTRKSYPCHPCYPWFSFSKVSILLLRDLSRNARRWEETDGRLTAEFRAIAG